MTETARLVLAVDSTTVDRGQASLRNIGDQAERTEKQTTRATDQINGGFKKMYAAMAAVAGSMVFRKIVGDIASFEQAMLGVQAVSGATGEQFAALEKQARELGATSVFSAQQAAEAQRFLAMAGFDANRVLEATPGILQLATAASLDLGAAADIASNALSGFRLPVQELSRVNDVLAKTAASSNTSVQQLGDALSYAAPLATSAGVSIEQTAAAIGALSDAGLQGSRAGTGLLGVIRQLSNVTPQAAEVLKDYGVSLDEVDITTHGLIPVIERLSEVNLSTGDAFKVFGSEAGAAAQILLGSKDRVRELTEELEDAEGAAKKAADILGSGLTASMKAFSSAAAESILQLGDSGLTGGLKSVIDTATGVLSVYNGMLPQFAQANDLTEEQAANLRHMATALNVVAGAAGTYVALTTAIKAATVAQATFNTVAKANPYILIATSVGAATVAIYEYMTAQDSALASTERLWRDAATSSAAYAVAQGRIAESQRLFDELTREQIEKQEELDELRERGFKKYGYHANKAAKLEREIKEIQEKRAHLQNLRMEADKAEFERRRKMQEEEAERLRMLNELQGLGSGEVAGGAEDERAREAAQKRLDALRESLMAETELINLEYMRRREIVLEALDQGLIDNQEANTILFDAQRDHQNAITDLEQQAADRRNRIAEQEAADRMAFTRGFLGQLSGLMTSESRKLFEFGKIAATANAIVAGIESAQDAWKWGMKFGGPPLAAAFAGASALVTGARIQAIHSTQFGGGGGSLGAGGPTGGIQTVPAAPAPVQLDGGSGGGSTLNITINGSIVGTDRAELADLLGEALRERIDTTDFVLVEPTSRNGRALAGRS